MLVRMYLRWSERSGYATKILDISRGRGGYQIGDFFVKEILPMAIFPQKAECIDWFAFPFRRHGQAADQFRFGICLSAT